ncbi:ApeI family dehydratase [Candidatus Binatus sp.]|jgi:3-hydroxymyristoyl/3-hydroxydecanoyl-(acyl carrier protein) dehydratase|uniref:ApeI family dehydratase n=1 Tax=Candidatus Binatus sp. TaxID=2811406 RepID=UPI002FDAB2F3
MSTPPVPEAAPEIKNPEIVGVTRLEDRLELNLVIPGALLYFRGHFPNFPILPGIVQLDWAIQYGKQHFALGAVSPTTIKIKFRKPIRPNHRVTLSLKHLRVRNSLEFNYTDAEGACSSGQIGIEPP